MKVHILFLVFVLYFNCELVVASNKSYIEGYCWRDFSGYIPSDAVPGGRDENGDSTFIGQAIHPRGFLTPGVIKRNSNKVFYEYALTERTAAKDIKILCSQHPERLKWIQVKYQEPIDNLNGTHLIIAGHVPGGALAIGKTTRENNSETAVGNVLLDDKQFKSLYGTQNKIGFKEDSYEVLVYDDKELD